MKLKKLALTIAVFVTLTVPATVFAATSSSTAAVSIRHFFGLGIDTSKLTDTQKADVSDYQKKMADLEKEFINKMVSNGSLTKEKGDAAIKKIETALSNGTYQPGGSSNHKSGMGRNRGMGQGMFGFDLSTLTTAQKAELKDIQTEMAENEKTLINRLLEAKIITSAQAQTQKTRIDTKLNKEDNPMGMGGFFNGTRMLGLDQSKLTTDQKTFFTDYETKNLELKKKMIEKVVSFGIITKVQGDSILERLKSMPSDMNGKGFKHRMRGNGTRNNSNIKQHNNNISNQNTKPL